MMNISNVRYAVFAAALTLTACNGHSNPPCSGNNCGNGGQSIYVGNVANLASSVEVFAPNASGNAPPAMPPIAGATTLINDPYFLFVDGGGRIWVGNFNGGAGQILAFAAGATGNVAPTVNISGASTQLAGPCGVFVDGAGKIYASDCSNGTINVYPAGSNGNVAPAQLISGIATKIQSPNGLVVDGAGNIWVGDCGGNPGIYEFAASATGNVAPMNSITYAPMNCVNGIAMDSTGRIYAAQDSGGAPGTDAIYVFAASASGVSTPVQTIQGLSTQLNKPFGVALDASGNIWVGNDDKVVMFLGTATGNVPPSKLIQGASTQMNTPYGVAIH
jgi:sugar lactone lactonase YvrE